MSADNTLAERRVADFERWAERRALARTGNAALAAETAKLSRHLACHLALPVLVNAEFVHLVRINFFDEPPAGELPHTAAGPEGLQGIAKDSPLDYLAEGDVLLSDLVQEAGNGFYQMEPETRRYLLTELVRLYGRERLRQTAALLWDYTEAATPWGERERLERAQKLTALNFLAPRVARRWLREAETQVNLKGKGDKEWLIAIGEELFKNLDLEELHDFQKSVVAIQATENEQYKFVGTGFIVLESLIVTCAYVVSLAATSSGQIHFQVEGSSRIQMAEVTKIDYELDIAVLTPTKPLSGVEPLKLVNSDQGIGHTFSALGHLLQNNKFMGLTGEITGLVQDVQGNIWLQLRAAQALLSGSPVWDREMEAVVGMISKGTVSESSTNTNKIVLAVPGEVIQAFHPTLQDAAWILGHTYAMPTHFTGRAEEQAALTSWLTDGPTLLVLRAMGGFGKSALVWQWLMHAVNRTRWPHIVWWNFYEDANFERFLEGALQALGVDPLPLGPRVQLDKLLTFILSNKILLIMDGFERALRAFSGLGVASSEDKELLNSGQLNVKQDAGRDCVSPFAEAFLRALGARPGFMMGRVLITTRLRPRALETHAGLLPYCRELGLEAFNPADAVAFFRTLGIRGHHAEIEAACAPYGYHPLTLSLLAGWIVEHPNPTLRGDIKAASQISLSSDLAQNRHHILEITYNSLTSIQQVLLSQIACFRSPVSYTALQSISKNNELDATLHTLHQWGLLHFDSRLQVYNLHPVIRHYAYSRLTNKAAIHARLRDYFAAIEVPKNPQTLDDLLPVIELYYHTARAGLFNQAQELFYERLSKSLYYQFGAYGLIIELLRFLFPAGESQTPALTNEGKQAWVLNELGNAYALSGQPQRAVEALTTAVDLVEKIGDKTNLAIFSGNLAYQQAALGQLRAAESNLRRRIELSQILHNEFWEAAGQETLGLIMAYIGQLAEAKQSWAHAQELFEKQKATQSTSDLWIYKALWEDLPKEEAIATARHALALVEESTYTRYPHPRNFVRAYWALGATFRRGGEVLEAQSYLREALLRCRAINLVEMEGDLLIELARCESNSAEAQRLAQEALEIAERCGYVRQAAEAHLVLVEQILSLEKNPNTQVVRNQALSHARAALTLATCDGEGYTYKIAYEEALKWLRELDSGEKDI